MPEQPVVIPEGVSPGDEFLARVAGKTITVKCPDSGEPGQTLMVAVDAPRPCSGEPKGRVKLSIGNLLCVPRIASLLQLQRLFERLFSLQHARSAPLQLIRTLVTIELGESEFNQGQNSNGLIVVLREQVGGGEWVEKTRTEILPSARKTWIEQKAPV
jgi:hypothetical protein